MIDIKNSGDEYLLVFKINQDQDFYLQLKGQSGRTYCAFN